MKLDLRLPIGLLFSLYGLILSVYGLTTDKAMYSKSLNININLVWGVVMLLFGVTMFILAMRSRKQDR